MSALTELTSDTAVIVKRNALRIGRLPEVLVFTVLQPIMFVVLFAYVFGSAVDLIGTEYREFLLAGIFVQTVVFGSTWTGAGIAEDKSKGVIDRFRSLPMSPTAVLLGRTLADILINALSIAVMMCAGLAVGWRIRTSVPEAVGGVLLLLGFAFALSWVMAYVGLVVPTVEVVNNASFMVIFPLTFIANTFVPLENLPTPLRVFAEWNPVSSTAQAARDLFGNSGGVAVPSGAFPIQHPVVYTGTWIVVLLAVFITLSRRRFVQAASR